MSKEKSIYFEKDIPSLKFKGFSKNNFFTGVPFIIYILGVGPSYVPEVVIKKIFYKYLFNFMKHFKNHYTLKSYDFNYKQTNNK